MKITGYAEGSMERQIVTAIIVSTDVLVRLIPKLDGEAFESKWSNLIARWCVQFYEKHKTAPGKLIQNVYEEWATKGEKDDATTQSVDKLLSVLSGEYEQKKEEVNVDYMVEKAEEHFTKTKIKRFSEEIQDDILSGDTVKVAERIKTFTLPASVERRGVDLCNDMNAIRRACEYDQKKSLIEYPSGLGDFFGDSLREDSFICLMGSDKCVDGDMEVVLSDGRIKTIKEIVEDKGDAVVMSLDRGTNKIIPMKVEQFWDNGIKECWRVKTKSGRTVTTTENHRYLTPDGWKYLEDIQEGEYIAVPKRLNVFGTKRISDYMVRFLAYMLAEGCVIRTKGTNETQCTFTNADEEIVNDFKLCCEKLGVRCRQYAPIQYGLSRNARPLLRSYGVMGHSSRTKTIPDAIFTCPKDQVAMFLRCFFSCDGWAQQGNDHIGVCLVNKKMVRQIGHLLTRFGIVYKFRFRWTSCNDKKIKAWCIDITSKENIALFMEEINMMTYKKRDHIEQGPKRSFLDTFPPQVARVFLRELQEEYANVPVPSHTGSGKGKHTRPGHAFRQGFGRKEASYIRHQLVMNLPIMRQSFVNADMSLPTSQKYMNADILWDKVVSVKSVGMKQTYDIAIPKHHNFVANDCIVHNSGKSFWLIDMAFRAMCQRKKVLYFEAGDMSEDQVVGRFVTRIARRPLYPCQYDYPKEMDTNSKPASVVCETRQCDERLDFNTAWKATKRLMKDKVKSEQGYLKIHNYTTGTLKVDEMRSVIQDHIRTGFVPSVICVDYADILCPPAGKNMDARDQTNAIWKELAALRLEHHCLVVTASQANAKAYGAETITRLNFSEDKRKLAHVTGMIGISSTAGEKAVGVCRLNWIVRRDRAYNDQKCCTVAGCLAVANPSVLSSF